MLAVELMVFASMSTLRFCIRACRRRCRFLHKVVEHGTQTTCALL